MLSKEKWYIRLLKWIGIIKEYEVPKKQMCEDAQSICNHECDCCAWNQNEENNK